ncbi:MAG: aa3-type cytochrome oxidase subunit II [Nocardioides sp.]
MGKDHRRPKGLQRLGIVVMLGVTAALLTGCDTGQWERIAMPEQASKQGEAVLDLWQGAWIAALSTGVVVWALMFWAAWRYRRRSEDEIPVQTRYNLPMEIFYTIFPIIMVIVFFGNTVRTQDEVLTESACPDNVVEVVGQQWQWTFNYGLGEADCGVIDANPTGSFTDFVYDDYAYVVGNLGVRPTLYLPLGESVRFNLYSPDVIHNFGIPNFGMRMDVIPGRINHYEITPTKLGLYRGACYELCGVYHSRMLFQVKVVEPAEYEAYVASIADTSQTPVLGGADAITQAGLDTDEGEQ